MGFKASGSAYFFRVAIAAASGSAMVKISSFASEPKPAFLAAVRVAAFASSDQIAGSVIQHSIGVFSNVESDNCWRRILDTNWYTSRRKSSQTPGASRKEGNWNIPGPTIPERDGSSCSPTAAFLSSRSLVHE